MKLSFLITYFYILSTYGHFVWSLQVHYKCLEGKDATTCLIHFFLPTIHHWLDGRESEWTPGIGDGQGGLACCDSQGCKESDMTEWLNWTELNSRYGKKQQEGIFFWTKKLVREVWSRDFATCKIWSSNNTLSDLSMKSSLDLGRSLSSTMGHNCHEMPTKHGQICGSAGTLLTGIWHLLASYLYKDYIVTTASC